MRTVRADPATGQVTPAATGVVTGAALGVVAQLALLAVLAGTVGLGGAGWVIGVAYGVAMNGALARALLREGAATIGPANRVTLTRATLVGGVAALVADSFGGPVPVPTMVALTTIALVLDAVDGWTARRTATVSRVGARFDMEVDAFLVLVLSIYDVRLIGGWVLAIGAARYLFVAASWVLPWLRRTAPPRYWNKVVAAIQAVVLTVAMADLLPRAITTAALLVALALLAESFGRQVWWLWRHRPVGGERAALTDAPVTDIAAEWPADAAPADAAPGRRTVGRIAAGVTTVLACLLVWFALLAPNDSSRIGPGAFVRIPIEALIVLALVLVLPPGVGRILAVVVGVVLGLLTIVKVLDMGFLAALNRPFNPLSDWAYVGSAMTVLGDAIGQWGAVVSVIAAAATLLAIIVLVPLAVRRLTRLAMRDRAVASRFVAAFAVGWVVSAGIGLQVAPGAPIASAAVAQAAYDEVSELRDAISDQQVFETAIVDDPAGRTPPEDLLTALRGKDVIITFVESYGRAAVQDSGFAPGVDAVLDAGTRRLTAAGFSSESAFLTSPTSGGISWLAHSTLQSGLWVDGQRRYDQLMASDRFTLSGAFQLAGWRTVVTAPANTEYWPEATSFYHYDQVYDSRNVGYIGPEFGFAAIPDQYTLAALHRAELSDPRHAPVMAEIDLLSSHTPWAPLPRMVEWSAVGDGSVFDGMPEQAPSVDEVWSDADQIRVAYGRSIEYTLNTIVSFVETYGDDDLVLLVVGDHQPAPVVSGAGADHDVPITIIAHDPAVLERVAAWGWQDGMNPGPQAPVWPMNSFRDRFLGAFGS